MAGADKTAIVKIVYDTDEAKKSTDELAIKIDGLKETTKKYNELVRNARKDLKKTDTQLKAEGKTRQGLTKTIREGAVASAKVKDQTKAASRQRAKTIKEITGEKTSFDKLNESLKENTKAQEKSTGALAAMPGAAGGAVKGMMAMVKASLAFIATPLGFVIAAIAAALMAVKAAFTSSEEGQNKFAKIMSVINTILGNLMDLLADVGEKLIWAVENPKKAWQGFKDMIDRTGQFFKNTFGNIIGGAIQGFVANLGKGFASIGLAWQKFKNLFTDNAEGINKAQDKIAGYEQKIEEAQEKRRQGAEALKESVVNAYNKMTNAVKGFIQQNIDEGKEAVRVANMRAKADIMERELLVERAELESKIAELRLKAREEDQYTAEQRRNFLIEARDLQDGLLSKEKEVLILRADAQKLENTFSRTNKENKTKEAEAIAAVSQKEAERFNQARQIQRELLRVDGQLESERKKIQEEEKKRAEEREKILKEETKRRAEAIQKIAEIEYQRVLNEKNTLEAIKQEKEKYAQAELNRELENIGTSFEEIQALKDELNEEELELELERRGILYEEYELLEAEHKAKLAAIDAEYNTKVAANREANLQQAFDSMQKIISATKGMAGERITIVSDAFSKITTINWKEVKSTKEAFVAIANAASGLTSLITAGHDKELADLEAKKAYELSLVGDNAEAQDAINRKYANESAKIKKQQAKDDKTAAIIDASIATAIGIVQALANPGGIAGIIVAALVGVLGGVQIAAIASQPTPTFKTYEKGGIIGGKPHSQGGTKFRGDDGSMFEAQKDESMFVLNKDATSELAAYSALNESHGGRSFFSRPTKHLQNGGEADTDNIQKVVQDEFQRTPIFVRTGDIETGLTERQQVKEAGVI